MTLRKHNLPTSHQIIHARMDWDSMTHGEIVEVVGTKQPWLMCAKNGVMYLHVGSMQGTFLVHPDGTTQFIKDDMLAFVPDVAQEFQYEDDFAVELERLRMQMAAWQFEYYVGFLFEDKFRG